MCKWVFVLFGLTIWSTQSVSAATTERNFTIFAGQSNIPSNGGIPSEVKLTSGETVAGVNMWINAKNSFEGLSLGVNTSQPPQSSTTRYNFGPEWTYSQLFRKYFDGPHYILKYAKGGTSMIKPVDWSPAASGPNLYTGMIDEVREIMKTKPADSRLACFVWGQGENDRNDMVRSQKAYEDNFSKMIQDIREATVSPHAIIAWPLLSYLPDGAQKDHTDRFRSMQARLSAMDHRIRLVATDDLPKRDLVHYTASAQLELGRRVFAACYPNKA